MKFSAGDFDSIDVAKVKEGQQVVETIHPRDGVYSSNDPADIDAFRSLGLTERTTAQVKASKARRTTKTRGAAGQKGTTVVRVEETGATDTRGPGAPAKEPGITEVGS